MFEIQLQGKASKKIDEKIQIEKENAAHSKYVKYMNMKDKYYFGRLVRIENGKEEGMASFYNGR